MRTNTYYHNAVAALWGERWRGDCAQCGWLGRPTDDQAAAERAAERHNRDQPRRDRDAHIRLYGPKDQDERTP